MLGLHARCNGALESGAIIPSGATPSGVPAVP